MVWVRIPDDLMDREEVLAVGLDALTFHLAALCYSNRNLTDGRVPPSKALTLVAVDAPRALIERLVAVGWWLATDGGYQLVYLLDLQPTREKVEHERAEGARRLENYRARKRAAGTNGDAHADGYGDGNEHGNGVTNSDPGPGPGPGPGNPDPVPDPALASGGAAANAASPRRRSKTATQVKLASIVDAVRAAGCEIHPTSRDGSALKSSAAPPELIAEAYIAAWRGVWDPVGDGFLRGNLSVHLVVGRIAGYLAERQPLARDYRAGVEHLMHGPGHNVHGVECDCALIDEDLVGTSPPATGAAAIEYAF